MRTQRRRHQRRRKKGSEGRNEEGRRVQRRVQEDATKKAPTKKEEGFGRTQRRRKKGSGGRNDTAQQRARAETRRGGSRSSNERRADAIRRDKGVRADICHVFCDGSVHDDDDGRMGEVMSARWTCACCVRCPWSDVMFPVPPSKPRTSDVLRRRVTTMATVPKVARMAMPKMDDEDDDRPQETVTTMATVPKRDETADDG